MLLHSFVSLVEVSLALFLIEMQVFLWVILMIIELSNFAFLNVIITCLLKRLSKLLLTSQGS